VSREGGSRIPPERPQVEGEMSEAEEVLSYWFPEDLADADMERCGVTGNGGWPEVPRSIGR
jgi:hypothetical protein